MKSYDYAGITSIAPRMRSKSIEGTLLLRFAHQVISLRYVRKLQLRMLQLMLKHCCTMCIATL